MIFEKLQEGLIESDLTDNHVLHCSLNNDNELHVYWSECLHMSNTHVFFHCASGYGGAPYAFTFT